MIWPTVFLHWRKNSSVIHHSCFLRCSFGVPELTSVFFLLKSLAAWHILKLTKITLSAAKQLVSCQRKALSKCKTGTPESWQPLCKTPLDSTIIYSHGRVLHYSLGTIVLFSVSNTRDCRKKDGTSKMTG